MSERCSLLTPFALGLIVTTVGAGCSGCKKDEPPPPLPSAAPAPTPTPTEQLTLVPEDAGAPVDAGEDAGKRPGGGTSMAKCCAALASNANLAPSPNKEILLGAATACSAAVGAGAGNAQVLAAVQGALRGLGMPASCK